MLIPTASHNLAWRPLAEVRPGTLVVIHSGIKWDLGMTCRVPASREAAAAWAHETERNGHYLWFIELPDWEMPPFRAGAWYCEAMDMTMYLAEDCSYRAQHIDGGMSVLWHPTEDRIVGVQLHGVQIKEPKK